MNYRTFKHSVETKLGGDVKWGVGHPDARVMLVGHQPTPGEKAPFTGGSSSFIRLLNQMIGVPDPLIFYNYLKKKNASFEWLEVLGSEIRKFTRPRAVVLLGADVATAMINARGAGIEDYRRVRWSSDQFPGTNFFVTYDVDEMHRDDVTGRHERPQKFVADLKAIYETDTNYFEKSRIF